MAKVKFSALISEMRGKLNGSVFTKNRFGNALRNKVTPVNRRTPAQAAIKTLFAYYTQKWRTLDQYHKKALNAAVEDFKGTNIFGDQFKPTGSNLYCQLNTNLALVGALEISKPPLPVMVDGIKTFSIEVDSTSGSEQFDIVFDPSPTSIDVAHLVFATRCYSPGKSNVNSEYRLIGVIESASATPFDALDLWNTKFGFLTKDQKVSVKLVPVNKKTGITFKGGSNTSTVVL